MSGANANGLPPARPPRRARAALGSLAALLCYAALLAALAWPWLREAESSLPATSVFAGGRDERLVVWILAWVERALGHGRRLWDAPVFFPAPNQLTGSEHLLTWQLAFVPLDWLGGNALLAASWTAFATYPLAAFALWLLLRELGCDPIVAWAGGLAFALGPLRVPANLHCLQYANLFLPWAALAMIRLREAPTPRRAAALALVLALALFSSYYTAVLVLVTAGVCCVAEATRRTSGSRARFLALAAAATAAACLALVLFSLPYFARPEASLPAPGGARPVSHATVVWELHAAALAAGDMGALLGALGAAGLVALPWLRTVSARRIRALGVPLALVAAAFMPGRALLVGGIEVPLPFAIIAGSPLRFFRSPARFVVVLGFAFSLLLAGLLQAAGRRRLRAAFALAAAGALVLTRGLHLGGERHERPLAYASPIYAELRERAQRESPGSLLELPAPPPGAISHPGLDAQPDSMLAATRHWVPLVAGFTGYPPPHFEALEPAIELLPAREALEVLADATRLRWILLRPAAEWGRRAPLRARILAAARHGGDLERVASRDGLDLLRVRVAAADDRFFRAIRAGPRPGRTALGAPLKAIEPASAKGAIHARLAGAVLVSTPLEGWIRVRNLGDAAWPAVPAHAPLVVELRARWRPIGAQGRGRTTGLALSWDVAPGAGAFAAESPRAPDEPGLYDLELRLRQRRGARFSSSLPIHHAVRVIAPLRRPTR